VHEKFVPEALVCGFYQDPAVGGTGQMHFWGKLKKYSIFPPRCSCAQLLVTVDGRTTRNAGWVTESLEHPSSPKSRIILPHFTSIV
jgi:hypothetical protein